MPALFLIFWRDHLLWMTKASNRKHWMGDSMDIGFCIAWICKQSIEMGIPCWHSAWQPLVPFSVLEDLLDYSLKYILCIEGKAFSMIWIYGAIGDALCQISKRSTIHSCKKWCWLVPSVSGLPKPLLTTTVSTVIHSAFLTVPPRPLALNLFISLSSIRWKLASSIEGFPSNLMYLFTPATIWWRVFGTYSEPSFFLISKIKISSHFANSIADSAEIGEGIACPWLSQSVKFYICSTRPIV